MRNMLEMCNFGVMILFLVGFGLLCVFGLGYKIGWNKSRDHHSPKQENPFIKAHQSIQERDDMYKKYVDWCYSTGTHPLENFEFFSELENNKKLREAVNKIMNS